MTSQSCYEKNSSAWPTGFSKLQAWGVFVENRRSPEDRRMPLWL
jgi:hypothetical protein